MSGKTARAARSSSNKAKGDLLENIAARMHEGPNVTVATRQWITPRFGSISPQQTNPGQREIDILLTASVGGYQAHVAIECKNKAKPIGPEYIDAFCGKLDTLGIPKTQGVYISVNGYTKIAKERALASGIQLFQLTGLTDDRLGSAVLRAAQSVVHLLLEVHALELRSSLPADSFVESAGGDAFPAFAFVDQGKEFRGTIFDLVWRMWREGKLPTRLGKYDVDVEIPDGWHQFVRGDDGNDVTDPVLALRAEVVVTGLIVTIQGTASQHTLVNAFDNTVKKGNTSAAFPASGTPEAAAQTSLKIVYTEEDLAQHVKDQSASAAVRVVIERLLLPRIRVGIRFGMAYWPPSEAMLAKALQLTEKYPDFSYNPTQEELGSDPLGEASIFRVWDPPHPLHRLP